MVVSQAYKLLWGAGIVFVIIPHLNLGLLSDYKICGDSECESLMSRAQAIRDHRGKDCRYLSFRQGDTIFVYHKLTGKREDLWAGTIDKQFGYFPKDAVQEEQVYATMERVVETQKYDFFCMDEFGYPVDSSHLDSDDNDDDDDDDDDQKTPNQEPKLTQTTPNTDDTNAEIPADVSTGSPVSAQEADSTSTEEDRNKNAGDAAAGTHEEAQETPTALNEQGGSDPSSWLGSSMTGWLGLAKEEETAHLAEGEKREKREEMQAEASVASSVTGWLGLGGEGIPDDAVKSREEEDDRESADSFTSAMTGWLGFRGEKETDHSAEKEQDEEREHEEEKEAVDTFRSRRMSLDLEGSQLHVEEKKDMGTLDWLGNGLSSTLGFGLTNQGSGQETTPEIEAKETIQEEAEQPASGSWLDMGIGDILGFRKDKSEVDESTGSGFKETEEDKTLEESAGSEDVDNSESQPALTEEVRKETSDESKVEETPDDQNAPSEIRVNADSNNNDIRTSVDHVLNEHAESKVDEKDISPQTMESMEGKNYQMPKSIEGEGEYNNREPGEEEIKAETEQDFLSQSDINLGPDLSSANLNLNSTGQSVDEGEDKTEDEIPNHTDNAEESTDMIQMGNNSETDVLHRETSTTDDLAEQNQVSGVVGKSGGKSQPFLSSGTAEERHEPISSEGDAGIDNNTEVETHQGEVGQEGEVHPVQGGSQEFGSSHSSNRSTDIRYENASEEDRVMSSISESTTQMVNYADQDSTHADVSPHVQQGATQSDGDAQEPKGTDQETDKDSENNITPVQTDRETVGFEKAVDSETETETETEEEEEEEKQGEIEESEEEVKQQEIKEIKEERKQQEVEELKEGERQHEVKGMKEEEKKEEVKEIEEGKEEIKEEGKQEEVEEIKEEGKQEEVEKIKEEGKQEEVEEIKEEGKQEEVEEIKEEGKQESMDEKEEEKQGEEEELNGEEKDKIEDTKEELEQEEKQQEIEELKEEEQEEVEELKEEEEREKLKEVEGVKEQGKKEGEDEESHFKEEVEDSLQSLPHTQKDTDSPESESNEKETQDESSSESGFSETSTRTEKRRTENPQMEEEKEEVEEVKDEMEEEQVEGKQETENVEDRRRNKEEEGSLKCPNELCPPASEDGLVRDRDGNDSANRLSSKDEEAMETGKQNPVADNDQILTERTGLSLMVTEGTERDEDVQADEGREEQDEEKNHDSGESGQSLPNQLSHGQTAEDKDDQLFPSEDDKEDTTQTGDTETSSNGKIDREEREINVKHGGMKTDDRNTLSEFRTEERMEVSVLSSDPVESQAVISEQSAPSDGQNKDTAESGGGGAFGLFKNAFSYFSQTPVTQTEGSTESALILDSNTGETPQEQTSPAPEQELDSPADSSQVHMQDLHTDSPVTPSHLEPPPPPFTETQTASPSPTQTHPHPTESPLQTKTLSKHYKNLLAHMSADETTILMELFGRHKLQFLDYILGSSETMTDDPDNDQSILLDIERLLRHHRETLVAPSMRLADAPQEDKEKTRTLIALQKLEMLLASVREAFNTAEASCVGESCSAYSKDKEMDDNTLRGEWMGVDKEKDGRLSGGTGKERVTEDEMKGEKGKESLPHIQRGSPQPLEEVMKPILDFVHQITEDSTTHVNAVRKLLIWLTVQEVVKILSPAFKTQLK